MDLEWDETSILVYEAVDLNHNVRGIPFALFGQLHVEYSWQGEGQQRAASGTHKSHQSGKVGNAEHNDSSQEDHAEP